MQPEAPLMELQAAPISHRAVEQISHVRFSPVEDLLWSGTESGWLYGSTAPELERYSSVRAHRQRVADLVALPAPWAGAALSLSAEGVRCHSGGGMSHFSYADKAHDLTCCAVDPGTPRQAVLGHHSGCVSCLDLETGQLVAQAGPVAGAIQLLRAPAPRGIAALGCAGGSVILADARAGFKAEASLAAHAGGLVAMDLGGSLLATAGLGTRQGRLVQDTIVKVYDLRAAARVLTTVPFGPGPQLLRFHPRVSGRLLLASSGGAFSLVDAHSSSFAPLQQVETEGDLLTGADWSASGECLAFGGSGGFVHLWAYHSEPLACLRPAPLQLPPARPAPAAHLEEGDSFAPQPPPFPPQEGWLSDWDPRLLGKRHRPPRVVDIASFSGSNVRRADFVTYVSNPHTRRGQPRGATARAVAALRNARQPLSAAAAAAESGLAAASRGVPEQYARARITVDAERRYEEFDFGRHNATRFAGLENGIANCYANALVQVLYFTPPMRAFLLSLVPDPQLEFSLLDELALLFRMLARESGRACQAANLLHAMRQSREAAGLGLLEGHAQKGAHAADVEVEASKDRSLARRVQSLQRFLLDKLHQEAKRRQAGAGSEAARQAPATPVAQVFGIRLCQRMQSLQGARPAQERESLAFQVDLQYPRRSKPGQAAAAPGAEAARPSFASVLAASLRAESETRAWFNDELKYQYVRQTRAPLALPQVLAVGTGLQDGGNLHWWQPQPGPGGGAGEAAWAPWALALQLREGGLAVEQAGSVGGLPEPAADGPRAVYELTAVIALVGEGDADAAAAEGGLLPPSDDGHLVAHVRVPESYTDPEVGLAPTPHARPSSPGLTPLSRGPPWGRQPPPARAQLDAVRQQLLREAAAAAGAAPVPGEAQEREGAAAEHGLPDDPFASDGEDASPPEARPAATPAGAAPEATSPAGSGPAGDSPGEAPPLAASPPLQPEELPQRLARLKVAPGEGPAGSSGQQPAWLLVNDFRISRTAREEALQLFGGRKRPCLLYYTQVAALDAERQRWQRVAPAEVLTHAAFHELCRAPPLQAGLGRRPPERAFVPLEPGEGPRPGMLLALDAEFVAYAPPARALRGGVEVETAAARLGLARVSVLRGEGPAAGTPAIDDYIRTSEPVFDHLTQFSGLRPGDLEPERSAHHLVTLKAAYLKLRFLVDCGCVFVGHGLKKDFRMVNVVVPPEQVVDTVDLFYIKRQRKLSLRFLAAYLLRQHIQARTHDSIEDARTALQLYQVYRRLSAEGRLREVLQEMYEWGKAHGWEPAALELPPDPGAV